MAACSDDVVVDPLEGPTDPVAAAHAFVDDSDVRRRAFLASVGDNTDSYSALRRTHYSLPDAQAPLNWDTLPEWNPRVRQLYVNDVSASVDREEGPVTDDEGDDSLLAWRTRGARAFERFPAQVDLAFDRIRDRSVAEAAGFSVDAEGRVRGVVEVQTNDGWIVALTCAACHAAVRGGTWLRGVGNDALNMSALGLAEWPLGTIDVTGDGIDNPTRPSDLRPIRLQALLHHTGNLRNGRLARMVRIETLLTVQTDEATRPNRNVVAAMALYLESLADSLPALDRESAGATAFDRECATCHRGDELAGDLVDVAVVGTNDAATRANSERSTGAYRAPSLRGVGDRIGLLHDGSAHDLDSILGLVPSPHAGHTFGLTLDAVSRRTIADYLAPASATSR